MGRLWHRDPVLLLRPWYWEHRLILASRYYVACQRGRGEVVAEGPLRGVRLMHRDDCAALGCECSGLREERQRVDSVRRRHESARRRACGGGLRRRWAGD
ncbi:MAG: hypothetical protein QME87_10000 [Bacillota bacterium]|nr:hypothetical protein [Bacillota bacterium]